MSREITRRSFIKGSLIGAGVLAAGPLLGTDLLAATKPARGGVWRVARDKTVASLDAHRVNEYFTSIGGMYDCLIDTTMDPKTQVMTLAPGLATKWQWENNGLRLVFELRKGVTFHDGSKFDAKVAKWNLDRVRNHPKSYLASDIKEIKDVEVLGDYAIAVNLSAPSGSLMYNLSSARQWAGMVSQAFQEKHGDDELARKGCGTGPFRYKQWIVDEKVVLERNPDYWAQGVDGNSLPYLDGMEEHYRPDLNKAVLDLRSGSIDAVQFPAARDVAAIKKDDKLKYVELPPFEFQKVCVGLNSRTRPLYQQDPAPGGLLRH